MTHGMIKCAQTKFLNNNESHNLPDINQHKQLNVPEINPIDDILTSESNSSHRIVQLAKADLHSRIVELSRQ